MRLVLVALVLLFAGPALAETKKPVPSGPLRAYKGPEGEIVVMVLANDDKQMLVHFRKIGGDLEGKTVLYEYEDLGEHGGKSVFINKKRGSKTYRSFLLTERDGQWEFHHPSKDVHLSLRYSEEQSDKIKLDDVLNAYKP